MWLDTDQGEATTTDSVVALSDEEVLALSITRPSLFALLVDRYEAAFLRKAERIVGTHEEAEDVVQETFMKVYVNAGRFRVQKGAGFKSWAYKILIHTACSRYQKLKRERLARVMIDPEFMELFPDGVEEAEAASLRDVVVSTLSRLPTHFARALSSHFLDDRSHKEVSDEEGVSVAVIKTRVLRAKQAFRKLQDDL